MATVVASSVPVTSEAIATATTLSKANEALTIWSLRPEVEVEGVVCYKVKTLINVVAMQI